MSIVHDRLRGAHARGTAAAHDGDYDALEQEILEKQQLLKDGIRKLEHELEDARAELETAHLDLARERKERQRIERQLDIREQELLAQIDRLERQRHSGRSPAASPTPDEGDTGGSLLAQAKARRRR